MSNNSARTGFDTGFDVAIVGGGPVGLVAAIEARLAGLSVVVIEQRAGVIDKACGEGLMPGAPSAAHPARGRPARDADHGHHLPPGRTLGEPPLRGIARPRGSADDAP
ncbi:MAG: FAD-dependent oxidoreductase [Galbitalea sp.]